MSAKNSKAFEFLYHIPVVTAGLSTGSQVAIQMAALASRQSANLRTRCEHPDRRAENVAEHSFMLAKVAPELAACLYPHLDLNLVARFATVHDDVEIYVGDTPTDMLAQLNPEAKADKERLGLQRLLEEYAHIPTYCAVVRDYEQQQIAEARFVRAVDKLMVQLVHLPNHAEVLARHYTYDSYLDSEARLLARDAYKYGEFSEIMELRTELSKYLAESYLRGSKHVQKTM